MFTSIKSKFIGLALAILLMISGMIYAGFSAMARIDRQSHVSSTAESLTASLREIMQGLAETIVIPDTPETLAMAREGIAAFDEQLAKLRLWTDDPASLQLIEAQISPVWGEAKAEAQALLARSRLNPDDVEVMIAFGRLTAKSEKLLVASRALSERSAMVKDEKVRLIKGVLGGTALAVMAAALFFFLVFYRSIVDPLRNLSEAASRVSEGDLSTMLKVDRRDELGDVVRSFASMVTALAATVRKTIDINTSIAATAEAANAVAGEMASAVNTQKSGVEQSASAIDELYRSYGSVGENVKALNGASAASAEAISRLSQSLEGVMRDTQGYYIQAERTVDEVREMIASSTAIAGGIDELRRFSQSSVHTIAAIERTLATTRQNAEEAMRLASQVRSESMDMGVASVRGALEGMERLEENMLALTETVNRLGGKSAEIGKIVTVIDEITTQTRLLALNASIIAAQAGQHGKGFAVVADEIRALADRTSHSTQEISEVILSVQQETQSSVERAREGEEAVRTGKALVAQVSDNLATINRSAELSAAKSAEILEAADSQAAVISAMARAVDELTGQIAQIARSVQTQQQGNSRVQHALGEFMTTAAQIKGAANEQQLAGESIAVAAQQVADLARQISGTIAEQKASTDHIIDVIQALNDSASQLLGATERLSATIHPLSARAVSLTTELKWFRLEEGTSGQP